MRILHTADLHLGQYLYQSYDRTDEHKHFFGWLAKLCVKENPDVLLLCGDVYDIQQPSASTRQMFTDFFVGLHKKCPNMKIIITAGNHDSALRIQADSAVWELANTKLVGLAPASDIINKNEEWQKKYVVELENGYVIALPYMSGERKEIHQALLDYVSKKNENGLPVVLMGHAAVTGVDATGHNIEIGNLKTIDAKSYGEGYDYFALGHIHKPQTIGHPKEAYDGTVTYPSPVVRYSGSALHVSCDEKYPHSVSIVDIDKHGGHVSIKKERIDERLHFYELPADGSSFNSVDEAIEGVRNFCDDVGSGYIRLRLDHKVDTPANFDQIIYDILREHNDSVKMTDKTKCDEEVRYNPKLIWTGESKKSDKVDDIEVFEVTELQQMENPIVFIEKTIDQYPELDLGILKEAFAEVEKELNITATNVLLSNVTNEDDENNDENEDLNENGDKINSDNQ